MTPTRPRTLLATAALCLGLVACDGGQAQPTDQQQPDPSPTTVQENVGQDEATDDIEDADPEQEPRLEEDDEAEGGGAEGESPLDTDDGSGQ